jgi:hypothetical protein
MQVASAKKQRYPALSDHQLPPRKLRDPADETQGKAQAKPCIALPREGKIRIQQNFFRKSVQRGRAIDS